MNRINIEILIELISQYKRPIWQYIYHIKKEDWGYCIYIIDECGRSFARVYWYDDDSSTIYLEGLSVNPNYRKCRFGTELQVIREGIGKILGARYSCLLVQKDSWMYEWYQRRGYEDFQSHRTDAGYIWMRKEL